jgi:hypothetical protein
LRFLAVVGIVGVVLGVPTIAYAEPVEVGPCNDPNAIVVRVGQTAKVCLSIPPLHHDE